MTEMHMHSHRDSVDIFLHQQQVGGHSTQLLLTVQSSKGIFIKYCIKIIYPLFTKTQVNKPKDGKN